MTYDVMCGSWKVRESRITGRRPAATMVRAGSALSSSSPIEASMKTLVASVSKSKGLRMSVAGSSFMQSTKTRSPAATRAGLNSGRCTSKKALIGPRPSVRAAAATLGVTF